MDEVLKIKCLIHEYQFQLDMKKRELDLLLLDSVTDLISVATVKCEIKLIEKMLRELNH